MNDDTEVSPERPPSERSTSVMGTDVEPSSLAMAAAPSLPTQLRREQHTEGPLSLQPGQILEDFQVVALLGRGGFGAVYLAWQISLGRQVALKISPQVGQEGRTLARLDHPHIVRVFSETVYQHSRLLCMQYVASIALDELLDELRQYRRDWTGADLLERIDAQHTIAAQFDPSQLADRQQLSQLNHVDAVCWIGGRLADALAHAHRHGVLHRDLKPGNILVSQYGRPMLVDFNLANFHDEAASVTQIFGGTLPYMSPEHLEAFDPQHPADSTAVTERSDIFSLGVVLVEVLTGEIPYPSRVEETHLSRRLSQMASDRRKMIGGSSEAIERLDSAGVLLRNVLGRALAPDAERRWKTADELSLALDSARELHATWLQIAQRTPFAEWCARSPFLCLTVLGLLPHVMGSVVNITYNLLLVTGHESWENSPRVTAFDWLVKTYNIGIYPVCIGLCLWAAAPVFSWWRGHVRGGSSGDTKRLAWLRRRVMMFPRDVIAIALLGWMPGAVWFPWGLHALAGPLNWVEIVHLKLSVMLSGLIALTYSALGVSYLSICVFYPRLWIDPCDFRRLAGDEVRHLRRLLRIIPFLAGAIPLVSAVLLITTSTEVFQEEDLPTFKLLTTGLIFLGMLGFQLALTVTSWSRNAIDAFDQPK